jgi:GTP cyclohydrolase II
MEPLGKGLRLSPAEQTQLAAMRNYSRAASAFAAVQPNVGYTFDHVADLWFGNEHERLLGPQRRLRDILRPCLNELMAAAEEAGGKDALLTLLRDTPSRVAEASVQEGLRIIPEAYLARYDALDRQKQAMQRYQEAAKRHRANADGLDFGSLLQLWFTDQHTFLRPELLTSLVPVLEELEAAATVLGGKAEFARLCSDTPREVLLASVHSGGESIPASLRARLQADRPLPNLPNWGANTPAARGPLLAKHVPPDFRNVSGGHNLAYGAYDAFVEALGTRDSLFSPMLQGSEGPFVPRPNPKWHDPEAIVTMDPYGFSTHLHFADYFARGLPAYPTIAITSATLHIPELKAPAGLLPLGHAHSVDEIDKLLGAKDGQLLRSDGKVVRADGGIRVTKIAIDPVWHLPGVAKRLGVPLQILRNELYKQFRDPDLLNERLEVYLPPIEGTTVYIVGDPEKIQDPSVFLVARGHDECNGSDAMGSDICTCRPYLVDAFRAAAEAAQNGGVGVVAYYRKEGRALGEISKYTVYARRQADPRGDEPERYLAQTVEVAGIDDARFHQVNFADPFVWLGIFGDRQIDEWLSSSYWKRNALAAAGIRIKQQVPIRDGWIPSGAGIEIQGKVADGYFADVTDATPQASTIRDLPPEVARLLSPKTIRERARAVFDLSLSGQSPWSLELGKMGRTADAVAQLILKQFPNLNVPKHSRYRHFEIDENRIQNLRTSFANEPAAFHRAAIDLVAVSVILDAGAGSTWAYTDPKGRRYTRSEGLAVASYDMFMSGRFSSSGRHPRVDADGLLQLTLADLTKGFQVTEKNSLLGLETRRHLLHAMGEALSNAACFGASGRPSGILETFQTTDGSATELLHLVQRGLGSIWPEGRIIDGIPVGDVTELSLGTDADGLIPFHKLQQWLTYSLIEPLNEAGIEVHGEDQLTGLAEYRNMGLFVDMGVMRLKPECTQEMYDATESQIVCGRALTIELLDQLAPMIRSRLGAAGASLTLAQILEGGTWKLGRMLAFEKREGRPPLSILLSGALF